MDAGVQATAGRVSGESSISIAIRDTSSVMTTASLVGETRRGSGPTRATCFGSCWRRVKKISESQQWQSRNCRRKKSSTGPQNWTKNKFIRKAFLHLLPFVFAFQPAIATMRMAESCFDPTHAGRVLAHVVWVFFIVVAPWLEFESLVTHFFGKPVK